MLTAKQARWRKAYFDHYGNDIELLVTIRVAQAALQPDAPDKPNAVILKSIHDAHCQDQEILDD